MEGEETTRTAIGPGAAAVRLGLPGTFLIPFVGGPRVYLYDVALWLLVVKGGERSVPRARMHPRACGGVAPSLDRFKDVKTSSARLMRSTAISRFDFSRK